MYCLQSCQTCGLEYHTREPCMLRHTLPMHLLISDKWHYKLLHYVQSFARLQDQVCGRGECSVHVGAVYRNSCPDAAALPDRRLLTSAPHFQPSRLLHVTSSVPTAACACNCSDPTAPVYVLADVFQHIFDLTTVTSAVHNAPIELCASPTQPCSSISTATL